MTTPNQWRKSHHLPVLSSRPDLYYGRLDVELSSTSFQEGKEFRISREFAVGATPLVFRVSSTVDFVLQLQKVAIDIGNVRFRAYRDIQGVASGLFDQKEAIYKQNFTARAKPLDPVVEIYTGGAFTPNVGETAVETIRLRVSGATSGQTSVSGVIGDERGLAAGTYYLVFARIDGNVTAEGVFDLKWEEIRPDE